MSILSNQGKHRLLYQGHGSLRIRTAEDRVIYIDPYAGKGYDLPADLILVSHSHSDHTAVKLIKKRSSDCRIITYREALSGGKYGVYDFGFAKVEAVQAGNNKNHDIRECVGWLITLSGGVSVYASCDTSKTAQMTELGSRDIHYAFFCCDGIYNMDLDEASECAAIVKARVSIPYHMAPGKLFDIKRAERFTAEGRLIMADGDEITLE